MWEMCTQAVQNYFPLTWKGRIGGVGVVAGQSNKKKRRNFTEWTAWRNSQSTNATCLNLFLNIFATKIITTQTKLLNECQCDMLPEAPNWSRRNYPFETFNHDLQRLHDISLSHQVTPRLRLFTDNWQKAWVDTASDFRLQLYRESRHCRAGGSYTHARSTLAFCCWSGAINWSREKARPFCSTIGEHSGFVEQWGRTVTLGWSSFSQSPVSQSLRPAKIGGDEFVGLVRVCV